MRKLFTVAAAVALGLSPVAAPAVGEDAVAAVGAYTGTLTYEGDGLPASGVTPLIRTAACRETRFDVTLDAVITVRFGDKQYAGPVTLHGSGRSGFNDEWRGCEDMFMGGGALNLSMIGTDPNGTTIQCEQLGGMWIRLETQWIGGVSGSCTLGGVTFYERCWTLAGNWTPTPVGGGVLTDTTGAVLTGVVHF